MFTKKISIKTNILIIFLILIGMVSISLLFSQYYFSQKIAIESTQKTFSTISNNITQHLNKEEKKVQKVLHSLHSSTAIHEPITFDPFHPVLNAFIQMLQVHNKLYAAYITQQNGHFYEVANLNTSKLQESFDAPAQTVWLIITIIDDVKQLTYLDERLSIIRQLKEKYNYNPLQRPWYKQAIQTNTIIQTKPYIFAHLGQAGITNAISFKNKEGVLAIDYTMDSLNNLLALQKEGATEEIFLTDPNGNIFASSKFSLSKTSQVTSFSKHEKNLFTKEEQQFIDTHPTLLVSNDEDWAPFDFKELGEPKGYSIDLMRLLAQKSGLKIRFSNGYIWSELMDMFQNKQLDVIHSLSKTPEREKLGKFTQPLYSFKNYFILNQNLKAAKTDPDLTQRSIAVIKGWRIESYLKTHYPYAKLVYVDNVSDAYMALSQGKVDLFVDSKESFIYMTKKLHLNNLQLGNWFKAFDNNSPQSIYIMVHNDQPILQSILNKTLASLSKEELENLKQKWFDFNAAEKGLMLDQPLIEKLHEQKIGKMIRYTHQDRQFFATFGKLKDEENLIGIKIDADQLLKPYHDNLAYSLLIAGLLLVLALPIIWFSANRIVKPIHDLIKENEKIKHRDFDTVKPVQTNIIEFIELSNSLVSMSQSINEYQKSQEATLDAIIQLIADAIDAKSPYTGGHCKRVPKIAQMLLEEASCSDHPAFASFCMTSEDELRAFEIGAWLHDCGKITTPEYVVDKATKLETIYNRIHEIRMRFEVLLRDTKIAQLNHEITQEEFNVREEQLHADFAFVAAANIGGEYMDEASKSRIRKIAQQTWMRHFDDTLGLSEEEYLRHSKETSISSPQEEFLLNDKPHHIIPRDNFDYKSYKKAGFTLEVPEHLYNYGELYNLCIERGTLSPEERYKINEHVIMSIKMLENIPFPTNMSNVPEYAGTHHETLIGTGYPRGLSKEALSIPARIMAIADIFEALTASDRPYKKAKTLSESLKIMSFMVKDQHIDADLFELFLHSGIYLKYAHEFLKPEQIDQVQIEEYLK